MTNKVRLTNETAFIGPNNAGKSVVFAALNLFRGSMYSQGVPYGTNLYHNLDNYYSAVYCHDLNRTIDIIVEFEENPVIYRYDLQFKPDIITKKQLFVDDKLTRDFMKSNIDQSDRDRLSKLWYISPNRTTIPSSSVIGTAEQDMQPLHPNGRNLTQFLERHSRQDPRWSTFEEWLKKIDAEMALFRTSLSAQQASLETDRVYNDLHVPIALGYQGTGIQNASIIISSIIFSPPGST
ncbi:MAG: AAA family ATPase, partial [Candidatus Nitrosopolaris sp.]